MSVGQAAHLPQNLVNRLGNCPPPHPHPHATPGLQGHSCKALLWCPFLYGAETGSPSSGKLMFSYVSEYC